MRVYEINDIVETDMERLVRHLENKDMKGSMEGLYWLDMPRNMLSAEQTDHFDDCGPYSLGLECEDTTIRLELLVRARNRLRCSCVAYADEDQRAYAMNTLDAMLRELDIPV